ncbi:hypothetical protein [Dactylosporangium matsuzakiense]|uniref:hypothetical protein n=1 Tax=Dactylosporangium matsuzakiense TaxID=53360 RepID=UPI0021C34D4B|nr:hypothetical protein [Dactylosporangium matsuzakiense]UWZ44686.1 HNH endonuclease [Dactylosporangium matsuzakiense]
MSLSAEVQAAVIAAYKANEPVNSIMQRFHIAPRALYSTLRDHGVAPNREFVRPPRVWTYAELDQITALRRRGATLADLESAMHASEETVREALVLLKEAGHRVPVHTERLVRRDGTASVWVAVDDPLRVMANRSGRIPEARLVAARVLGRPLTRNERVFHRNGDRTDCSPANLIVRSG